jgi:hypothetical protein
MVTLWLFVGGAVGALHALTLWWTVAHLRPESAGRALARAWGGALVRWTTAAGMLIVALQHGIVPGLLAFAGLWLARWGMVCKGIGSME